MFGIADHHHVVTFLVELPHHVLGPLHEHAGRIDDVEPKLPGTLVGLRRCPVRADQHGLGRVQLLKVTGPEASLLELAHHLAVVDDRPRATTRPCPCCRTASSAISMASSTPKQKPLDVASFTCMLQFHRVPQDDPRGCAEPIL